MCVSIPPQRKVNGNSKGRGVAKAKFFKEKYGGKLEFPEGYERCKKKKKKTLPSVEVGGKLELWIFSGTTQSKKKKKKKEIKPSLISSNCNNVSLTL